MQAPNTSPDITYGIAGATIGLLSCEKKGLQLQNTQPRQSIVLRILMLPAKSIREGDSIENYDSHSIALNTIDCRFESPLHSSSTTQSVMGTIPFGVSGEADVADALDASGSFRPKREVTLCFHQSNPCQGNRSDGVPLPFVNSTFVLPRVPIVFPM